MNKFSVVILFALVFTNFSLANSGKYKCKTPIVDSKRVRVDDEELTERQMKITTEIINRNSTSHNQTFYDTVTKLLEVNVRFFSDLLTIRPRYSGDMIFDTCCALFSFPGNNQQYDSDLHVFVEINTYHKSKYIQREQPPKASSEPCKVIRKEGTTHGLLYINQNDLVNETPHIINLVIQHEFLHLLGFFINDVRQFNLTNLSYEIIETQNGPLVIVTSPQVKKIVQEYIGCKELNGFPLNNENSDGTQQNKLALDGHWGNTSNYDLMDRSLLSDQTVFSQLSAAYLKDTGFYTKVNDEMAPELRFFQNKGCSIFSVFNTTTNKLCPKPTSLYEFDGQKYFLFYTNPTCKFYEFLPYCTAYLKNEYNTNFQIENETQSNKKCFLLKNHTITIDESLKDFPAEKIQNYEINVHYLESSCDVHNKVQVSFKESQYNCGKDREEINIIDENITLICPDRLSEFCN